MRRTRVPGFTKARSGTTVGGVAYTACGESAVSIGGGAAVQRLGRNVGAGFLGGDGPPDAVRVWGRAERSGSPRSSGTPMCGQVDLGIDDDITHQHAG